MLDGSKGNISMNKLPTETFNDEAYLDANPDVRSAVEAGAFESGWDHYRKWGRREGRAINSDALMSRGEKLCAGLDLAETSGVEIGPLTAPVVRKDQSNVLYVDHADTETLRRKYSNDDKIDPDHILPVDHVWGAQTLQECVGAGVAVDYVIASHVIEHVPDLVTWLQEVYAILRPGGTVRLAIPDRRYTFDVLRAESTLADALDAYVRRARIPLPRAILDHFLHHAEIDAASAWSGQLTGVKVTHTPEFALQAAERSFRDGHYQDTHCWVLTPLSFARLGAALVRLGLISLTCERLYPTGFGELEFVTILRSAEPDSDCIASWDRAIERLEADQSMAHHPPTEPELALGQRKGLLPRLRAFGWWR